uniref:Uncharacterized protein n=1 Tax=Octopus bimaculoides TaxID=37653 RepID=A0A0L8FNX9_OCTBM
MAAGTFQNEMVGILLVREKKKHLFMFIQHLAEVDKNSFQCVHMCAWVCFSPMVGILSSNLKLFL